MFSSRFWTWTCPQLVYSWVLMYKYHLLTCFSYLVFGVVYLKLNMRFPLQEFWNFQSESGMHLLVLFGLESRMYLLVLFQLESGKYVFVLLQWVAIGVRNVSLRLFSIKVWNWTSNVHVSLLTTTIIADISSVREQWLWHNAVDLLENQWSDNVCLHNLFIACVNMHVISKS